MSQHICETVYPARLRSVPVEVTLGYDRPLDYVFCTVIRKNGNLVYSNLDDPAAGTDCQDVEYFRPILATLGIAVPESLFTEVKADQAQRIGNRVVRHG